MLRYLMALMALWGIGAANAWGQQGLSVDMKEEQTGESPAGAVSQHLRVEVETKYAWIYQKSIARVWATASKDDTTRVNVGELCLQLDCYGMHRLCETDTSYLEVTEIKRRLGVSKKTAFVKAWSNDPAMDTVRVEMKP